jgi:hypothetical protein
VLIALLIFFLIIIFVSISLLILWHAFLKDDNWWQKWQKRKVIALFQKTENGKKLLKYIEEHKIEFKIPFFDLPEGYWAAGVNLFHPSGILIVNKKDLASMSKNDGCVESSIAHELGHIAIDSDDFLDISICPYLESDEYDFPSSCPYKEFLAWKRGWQILQELKIDVDENKFWRWALEAIKTYLPNCQLGDLKNCEKLMINGR